jgi:hypothetical protein
MIEDGGGRGGGRDPVASLCVYRYQVLTVRVPGIKYVRVTVSLAPKWHVELSQRSTT